MLRFSVYLSLLLSLFAFNSLARTNTNKPINYLAHKDAIKAQIQKQANLKQQTNNLTKVHPNLKKALQNLNTDNLINKHPVFKSSKNILQLHNFRVNDENMIQVKIIVDKINQENLNELKTNGVKIERVRPRKKRIQAWINPQDIESIAELDFVKAIKTPSYGTRFLDIGELKATTIENGETEYLNHVTEGDSILNADDVRNQLEITGNGVKIGVISDGVHGLFESVLGFNVPGGNDGSCFSKSDTYPYNIFLTSGVTCKSFNFYGIDKDSVNNHGAEGTAMLEIIYDMVPDAKLYFANFATEDDFMDAMEWLAAPVSEGGAGVDIIVDDIGWFGEPYFEDGEIALTAKDIVDSGVIYITAAGNMAEVHVQEKYVDSNNDRFHNFQGTADKSDAYVFAINAKSSVTIVLQWDDEFNNPTHDLDFYVTVYNEDGEVITDDDGDPIVYGSTDYNITITKVAIEIAGIANENNDIIYGAIFIDNASGDSDVTFELFTLHSIYNEYATEEDSIVGQAAVTQVITAAAIDQADPGNNDVNYYSSLGPSTVYGVPRDKPDVAGIDGVTVTGSGGFSNPFYGTSAAGPHIAACLALVLEANPALTILEVKDVLFSTAVDVESAGFDIKSGHGRVDCFDAVVLALSQVDEVQPDEDEVPEDEVPEDNDADDNNTDDPDEDMDDPDKETDTNTDPDQNDKNDPTNPSADESTSTFSSGCSLQTQASTGNYYWLFSFLILFILMRKKVTSIK